MEPTMRRVIIESPYAGDVERNLIYARRALRDSLHRGEAPLASHLLYTQVLNDNIEEERALGIAAGLEYRGVTEWAAFYMDYGMSDGMRYAMELYKREKITTVQRFIGKNP